MPVKTESLSLSTQGDNHTVDITPQVYGAVQKSGLRSGIASVFVPGSTGGITTIEYESGAVQDLDEVLEKLVPRNIEYKHNLRWGDGNGHSHIRAALVGPSLTVPFSGGQLMLGTWQQIVFVDFDNRSRQREVVVQIIGE
jgi:secondary thiamine-phosphate synthase enzyme